MERARGISQISQITYIVKPNKNQENSEIFLYKYLTAWSFRFQFGKCKKLRFSCMMTSFYYYDQNPTGFAFWYKLGVVLFNLA